MMEPRASIDCISVMTAKVCSSISQSVSRFVGQVTPRPEIVWLAAAAARVFWAAMWIRVSLSHTVCRRSSSSTDCIPAYLPSLTNN
jgi:hypothetical protein